MKRSLKITSIMKIPLRILNLIIMVRSFLYGDFQLKKVERRTLLLFVGIPGTKICSLLVMDPMTFCGRAVGSFVVTLLKIRPGQSTNLQLNLVLCALISILSILPCLLWAATMVQSWSLISETKEITNLPSSPLSGQTNIQTPSGR